MYNTNLKECRINFDSTEQQFINTTVATVYLKIYSNSVTKQSHSK